MNGKYCIIWLDVDNVFRCSHYSTKEEALQSFCLAIDLERSACVVESREGEIKILASWYKNY